MNSREEQIYTGLVNSGWAPEDARRIAVERAAQEHRESSNKFWTIIRVAIVLLFAYLVATAAASVTCDERCNILSWVIGVATFIVAFGVALNVQYWLRRKFRGALRRPAPPA
jgi:protein-S-isoprenylcysteine O-methyltransferase Ste14